MTSASASDEVLRTSDISDASIRTESEDQLARDIGQQRAELIAELSGERKLGVVRALQDFDEDPGCLRVRSAGRLERQERGVAAALVVLTDEQAVDVDPDRVVGHDRHLGLDRPGYGVDDVRDGVGDASAVLGAREYRVEVDVVVRRERAVPLAAVEEPAAAVEDRGLDGGLVDQGLVGDQRRREVT